MFLAHDGSESIDVAYEVELPPVRAALGDGAGPDPTPGFGSHVLSGIVEHLGGRMPGQPDDLDVGPGPSKLARDGQVLAHAPQADRPTDV